MNVFTQKIARIGIALVWLGSTGTLLGMQRSEEFSPKKGEKPTTLQTWEQNLEESYQKQEAFWEQEKEYALEFSKCEEQETEHMERLKKDYEKVNGMLKRQLEKLLLRQEEEMLTLEAEHNQKREAIEGDPKETDKEKALAQLAERYGRKMEKKEYVQNQERENYEQKIIHLKITLEWQEKESKAHIEHMKQEKRERLKNFMGELGKEKADAWKKYIKNLEKLEEFEQRIEEIKLKSKSINNKFSQF